MFVIYSILLDRWFSAFVKYLLCNSLVCYLCRIYTFNKLSGPKTRFCLLWCLVGDSLNSSWNNIQYFMNFFLSNLTLGHSAMSSVARTKCKGNDKERFVNRVTF